METDLLKKQGCVACLLLILSLILACPTLAKPFAYIPNSDGVVMIIDTATDTIVGSVNLGGGPGGVSVHPDGSRVYVKNVYLDSVAVIDTSDNSVITNVTVGTGPSDIAVLPDGSRIYIALYDLDIVAVIDSSNNGLLTSIAVGDGPFGIDTSPDNSRVYIANRFSNTVSVIDSKTNTVISDIPIGDGDGGIAVHPDGSRVYVTSFNIDQISVIDAETNTVINTMSSEGAFGVAITPDGSRLYVTNFSVDTIEVYDTATNTIITTVSVGDAPYGLDITPDGLYAYVVNYWDSTISVINTSTNVLETTIPMQRRVFAFSSFIGPSPIGGSLTGFVPGKIFVGCVNLRTDQTGGFPLLRSHVNWSCETMGVELDSGDTVIMLEWGTSVGDGPILGGTLSGIVPGPVYGRCKNPRSGQIVEFLPEPGKISWDCKAMGLRVLDGDQIMMYQIGTVK